MKNYTSFNEIDRDLRYLHLKTQIEKEELKLVFSNTKETISSKISPVSLAANVLGAVVKKAFVLKMVEKLTGIKKVKKTNID